MVLCTNTVLNSESLIGDPTEGTLIVLGTKRSLDIDETRQRPPRVAEVPFDSEYRFMSTFHEMQGANGRPVIRCYVKGTPDVLISKGTTYITPSGERPRSQMRTASSRRTRTLRRRKAGNG